MKPRSISRIVRSFALFASFVAAVPAMARPMCGSSFAPAGLTPAFEYQWQVLPATEGQRIKVQVTQVTPIRGGIAGTVILRTKSGMPLAQAKFDHRGIAVASALLPASTGLCADVDALVGEPGVKAHDEQCRDILAARRSSGCSLRSSGSLAEAALGGTSRSRGHGGASGAFQRLGTEGMHPGAFLARVGGEEKPRDRRLAIRAHHERRLIVLS